MGHSCMDKNPPNSSQMIQTAQLEELYVPVGHNQLLVTTVTSVNVISWKMLGCSQICGDYLDVTWRISEKIYLV